VDFEFFNADWPTRGFDYYCYFPQGFLETLIDLSTPPEGRVDKVSFYNNGAITKLTIAITLIKIFIAGPEVSLNGSPTVSPTTVAA
jgi:hypothetical protein